MITNCDGLMLESEHPELCHELLLKVCETQALRPDAGEELHDDLDPLCGQGGGNGVLRGELVRPRWLLMEKGVDVRCRLVAHEFARGVPEG